jgi:hypothetical protein
MKFQNLFAMTLGLSLTATLGCSAGKSFKAADLSSEAATQAIAGRNATSVAGAGSGSKIAGQGSLTVPTGDALIERLKVGLQNNVNPTSGNFAKSLAQVKGNLPKDPDPTKASGYDQAQLLIYGACSDLTTGTTPKMKSAYGVDPKVSAANSQAALIAAGMKMMDQYTAGLASSSTATSQVQAAFSNLVQTVSSGNSTTIAFMSVCIAANSAGTMLLGF